jgi:ribosomal protein L37AE/L43A
MATQQNLQIELNDKPKIVLVCMENWACPACSKHIAVVAGDEWSCVACMMEKAGKDMVVVSGWQLSKSGVNQINATRVSRG